MGALPGTSRCSVGQRLTHDVESRLAFAACPNIELREFFPGEADRNNLRELSPAPGTIPAAFLEELTVVSLLRFRLIVCTAMRLRIARKSHVDHCRHNPHRENALAHLAVHACAAQSTVSRIESGQLDPTWSTMQLLPGPGVRADTHRSCRPHLCLDNSACG